MKAACLALALERRVVEFCAEGAGADLGHLETRLADEVQEILRAAAEKGAQAKADATPRQCPVCGGKLSRCSGEHARKIQTRFGEIRLRRVRGYCRRCRKWRFPADAVLGIEESAGYSPAVQEMAALLASKMPVADASLVLERLTGLVLPRATLDREARRQGRRAQALRQALDQKAATAPRSVATQLELTLEPYQMIIELDAWNIRERDQWGRSEALRRRGQEPERWHWVYTGTVFRLDQRAQTAGGRPVIIERGFVATREGIDGLREQLHAEALRRGLGGAAGALIIADGAAWIWRLADDRWPEARQRLDFYHAASHLATVARALFGEDKEKLKKWLKPLVRQLKNQSALKVITQLEQALGELPPRSAKAASVRAELDYLREHQKRMDYAAAPKRGEPIGSGAIEATCRQSQCRFKRPGQFWSRAGDEALLCLETFWRNGRWNLLFPHAPRFEPSKN